jgi:RNA polymerase sigma-70 factor (ECF subfamily)
MQRPTETPSPAPSDTALVAGVLEGDEGALAALFDRYAEPLRRHAVHIVHDAASAHDVVQETFLRVWNRAAQWDGSGSFRAWLYRITTNLALNHLRTQKRRREVPLELPQEPEDEDDDTAIVPAWAVDHAALGPEAAVMLAERRAACRHLVAGLDDAKRRVVRLVHGMEMSVQEAADVLDLPEGTVKSRLYYARKHLARQWRALDGDG